MRPCKPPLRLREMATITRSGGHDEQAHGWRTTSGWGGDDEDVVVHDSAGATIGDLMKSGPIAAISSRARSRARFSPRRCRRLHKCDSDFKPDLPPLVAITHKGEGKIGV